MNNTNFQYVTYLQFNILKNLVYSRSKWRAISTYLMPHYCLIMNKFSFSFEMGFYLGFYVFCGLSFVCLYIY